MTLKYHKIEYLILYFLEYSIIKFSPSNFVSPYGDIGLHYKFSSTGNLVILPYTAHVDENIIYLILKSTIIFNTFIVPITLF